VRFRGFDASHGLPFSWAYSLDHATAALLHRLVFATFSPQQFSVIAKKTKKRKMCLAVAISFAYV
jgi:hypothetical protein